jgi:hypothetical protein
MRRLLRHLAAALSVVALILVTSAIAQAGSSHTARFTSFHLKVGCGVQLKRLGGMSCFSPGLPHTELDGYVELHARGAPKLGERGDSPWRSGKVSKLRKGDRWSRVGVICMRKRLLRCTNQEGHGFSLNAEGYELF